MKKTIVAVDAGGSKTKFCILDSDHQILYTHLEESGSCAVVGEERAMRNIHRGLKVILDYAKDKYIVQAVAMGISGLGALKDKRVYEIQYEQEFGIPMFIESDATLALYSIVTDQHPEGVLVLSGTGAAILGINNGRTQLMSGWGHLLTEKGSAYSTVRDLICDTITSYESTGKPHALGQRFMDLLGFTKLESFRTFVYQNTKREIASYSRFVVEEAEAKQDPEAIALLEKGGRDLAKDVKNVARALNLSSNAVVGFRGGFIVNSQIVQNALISSLEEMGLQFKLVTGDPDPIYGAIYIAKERGISC